MRVAGCKHPFQSTRPLRGGTRTVRANVLRQPFQSTRPLRGGTSAAIHIINSSIISIHPPLAGRDVLPSILLSSFTNFNPPAPCGAGPKKVPAKLHCLLISIHPPLAGRDPSTNVITDKAIDFNPPAPCGAGPAVHIINAAGIISIHPPLAGRDRYYEPGYYRTPISIHPPLAGRDLYCQKST